jgi:predicted dehydrogenase
MKKVRLGIIGCGIIVNNAHWPAIKSLPRHFQITAVCNRTEPKAKAFAKLAGNVPYTLDYRELLKRDDVDAVDIAGPIALNYELIKNALAAGKHVIAEKPLAGNIADARKLVRLAPRYKRTIIIAENSRYRLLTHRAKDLLESGIIGKPYAVIWNVLLDVTPDNKYAMTWWRKNPTHFGGFVTDGGVHNIATLRILLGEIVRGSSWCRSVNPDIGRPDTFSLQFETDRNISGVLNIFFSARGLSEHALLVMGTAGTMRIENETITIKRTGRADKVILVADRGGFRQEFLAFHDKIVRQDYSPDSVNEAYRDFAFLVKAIRTPCRILDFTSI